MWKPGRRWSSNLSGKCLYAQPTRGTVCGTMRSMCSADAGCLAINDQSLWKPDPQTLEQDGSGGPVQKRHSDELRRHWVRPYPEYSRANSYHWSPFPPRWARPGPGFHPPHRFRAKREPLRTFQLLFPESQGQNLALTVLCVPRATFSLTPSTLGLPLSLPLCLLPPASLSGPLSLSLTHTFISRSLYLSLPLSLSLSFISLSLALFFAPLSISLSPPLLRRYWLRAQPTARPAHCCRANLEHRSQSRTDSELCLSHFR